MLMIVWKNSVRIVSLTGSVTDLERNLGSSGYQHLNQYFQDKRAMTQGVPFKDVISANITSEDSNWEGSISREQECWCKLSNIPNFDFKWYEEESVIFGIPIGSKVRKVKWQRLYLVKWVRCLRKVEVLKMNSNYIGLYIKCIER
ncbi:unnamed protein product [Owenia fusiformis]|uniref:Uncharacterized protein n=1 Tax=Owenia fusiformis TaxID=6347 RepID=A0A8S4Q9U5_OWEFU|nr:unnamed protein product [Owenia fusiformis]